MSQMCLLLSCQKLEIDWEISLNALYETLKNYVAMSPDTRLFHSTP